MKFEMNVSHDAQTYCSRETLLFSVDFTSTKRIDNRDVIKQSFVTDSRVDGAI